MRWLVRSLTRTLPSWFSTKRYGKFNCPTPAPWLPNACRKHVLAAATVSAQPALPAAAAAHTISSFTRLHHPATTNGSCCSSSSRRLKPAAHVALERWVDGAFDAKGLATREVEHLGILAYSCVLCRPQMSTNTKEWDAFLHKWPTPDIGCATRCACHRRGSVGCCMHNETKLPVKALLWL